MFDQLQIISKQILLYIIFQPRFIFSYFLPNIGRAKYFESDDSWSKKFTYTSEVSSSYSINCLGCHALKKTTAIQSSPYRSGLFTMQCFIPATALFRSCFASSIPSLLDFSSSDPLLLDSDSLVPISTLLFPCISSFATISPLCIFFALLLN